MYNRVISIEGVSLLETSGVFTALNQWCAVVLLALVHRIEILTSY